MLRMLLIILLNVTLLKFSGRSDNYDIVQLNQRINRAELLIVRDSIFSAIEYYECINKTAKLLSTKDLYNLTICYLKVGDSTKAKALIDSLILGGVEIDFLMKNQIIANCFSKSQFLSTSKNKRYSLKDSLDLIFKSDQFYRTTIYKNSINSLNIRRADSINNQVLLKIVADYKGLPGERIIRSYSNSVVFQRYLIHVLHQSFGSNRCYDYSEIIFNTLKEGTYNAHLMAYLYQRVTGNQTYFGPLTLITAKLSTGNQQEDSAVNQKFNSRFFIPKLTELQRKACEDNRKKYGLDSVDEFIEKAKFQISNPEFEFYYLPFINSTYFFSSKKKMDEVLKSLE